MKRLNSILGAESFPEEYTYLLPREEAFAKFAAIAAYGGEKLLKWHQDFSKTSRQGHDRRQR